MDTLVTLHELLLFVDGFFFNDVPTQCKIAGGLDSQGCPAGSDRNETVSKLVYNSPSTGRTSQCTLDVASFACQQADRRLAAGLSWGAFGMVRSIGHRGV